jgi:hypothetical protein
MTAMNNPTQAPSKDLSSALAELDRWQVPASGDHGIPFNQVLTNRGKAMEGLIDAVRAAVRAENEPPADGISREHYLSYSKEELADWCVKKDQIMTGMLKANMDLAFTRPPATEPPGDVSPALDYADAIAERRAEQSPAEPTPEEVCEYAYRLKMWRRGDGWLPHQLAEIMRKQIETAWSLRAAQPPVPALNYHKLCDALQQAMLHECVPDMQTDDGIDYRFLDLMSDQDSTIDTGRRRIEIFAERIADAVLEHLDSPALTKAGEQP